MRDLPLTMVEVPGGVPCYLIIPNSSDLAKPPLVSVHGISRNAADHAATFALIAKQENRVVIAPLFRKRRGQHYQHAIAPRRNPARALLNTLTVIGKAHNFCADQIHLFGFSGGAQFAHRFALLHPDRVRSLMVASAGWYTCLSESYPFPYGTDISAAPTDQLHVNLRKFVEIPMSIWVGERDTRRDSNLNKTRLIDRRQGLTRVERAARWTREVRSLAEKFGVESNINFATFAECGHDFGEFRDKGGLVARVADAIAASMRRDQAQFAAVPPTAQLQAFSAASEGLSI